MGRSWDVDLEERVDPARPGLMEAKVEVTSKFLLLDLEKTVSLVDGGLDLELFIDVDRAAARNDVLGQRWLRACP